MDYFAQQAINAVQLGSIYALIALGYSMVYGVLVMINFAHGDVFMVSAFFCFLLLLFVPAPFVVALIVVMLATALLGVCIERLAYRPLRNAPRVSSIITALGCGLVIQNTTLSLSPYSQRMPELFHSKTWQFGEITVSSLQVLIVGVSVGLMLALDFFIRRTRYGLAMRAIAQDRLSVPLMGIPVNTIISMTFAIGAGLGGAAGVLYGLAYPVIGASMGMLVGWKAFVAAVIGGIGNMRGAVLGGYMLGAVEVLTVTVLPSTYRDLVAYSLLLVILIFKPHGLLGRPSVQKV
ncbi:MAG: branched-chain amino acid ABC transporter permease [Verrucomicrobia bacterium]|jgi:branched-chain amino acid transport system permease protein|nr:branched-chain amino acid ABC transporter permease [Verrucomicrobiota bacterium]